jgi:tetratricopeptide (TPR) repeat protein
MLRRNYLLQPFVRTNSLVRLATMSCGVFFFGALAIVHAKQPQNRKSEPPPSEETWRAVSVETRPQLFATLCALDAAGFDADGNLSSQSPGLVQLRERMLALQGPAVDALRQYYRAHALANTGATLSRFLSFALAAGLPPKFEFELRRDELPPDALALEGFNQVLANFYREAQLGQLWQRYQPDYERGVQIYRAPVSEIVLTVLSYLREIIKSDSPRTFSVYVEPLASGKIYFRNYGDHYVLVVSPGPDLPRDAIRHALLHFLLDPIVIRYRTQAAGTSPLLEYAARAPRLPVEFHDDYPAFLSECLVRAVELRLRHLAPGDLASAIDQAESSGYVLVRPLYAGLFRFEKSEPAMSYYFPDLIKSIDVAAEARRLRGVKFSDAAAADEGIHASESAPVAASKSASPQENDLAEGQRQISARNGASAAASFERVLATHPNDLRATYGLAVASALLGKPERARELFSKVIAAASQNSSTEGGAQPEPANLSWSHIYLGRMYDIEGRRDLAVAEYQAALAVQGAPESARAAAQRGVEEGYQTPLRKNKSDGNS